MKFDVIIAHLITGLVLDTADFNREEHEAKQLERKLNAGNLREHLIGVTVPAESTHPGDTIPVDEAIIEALLNNPHKKSSAGALAIYYTRKANCVCVVCESPSLETTTRCAKCAQRNREASAKSEAMTV